MNMLLPEDLYTLYTKEPQKIGHRDTKTIPHAFPTHTKNHMEQTPLFICDRERDHIIYAFWRFALAHCHFMMQ
jgi:hypothetical protein